MPSDQRQVFLENVVSGTAAHLPLAPGIKVCVERQGLALRVAREALQAKQLQKVLERRFEQAQIFDGCFVYLDTENALVIWHALPTTHNTLDKVLSRMLALANLGALDAHTNS